MGTPLMRKYSLEIAIEGNTRDSNHRFILISYTVQHLYFAATLFHNMPRASNFSTIDTKLHDFKEFLYILTNIIAF